MGCGCLSLGSCTLRNPGDSSAPPAAAHAAGSTAPPRRARSDIAPPDGGCQSELWALRAGGMLRRAEREPRRAAAVDTELTSASSGPRRPSAASRAPMMRATAMWMPRIWALRYHHGTLLNVSGPSSTTRLVERMTPRTCAV